MSFLSMCVIIIAVDLALNECKVIKFRWRQSSRYVEFVRKTHVEIRANAVILYDFLILINVKS